MKEPWKEKVAMVKYGSLTLKHANVNLDKHAEVTQENDSKS